LIGKKEKFLVSSPRILRVTSRAVFGWKSNLLVEESIAEKQWMKKGRKVKKKKANLP